MVVVKSEFEFHCRSVLCGLIAYYSAKWLLLVLLFLLVKFIHILKLKYFLLYSCM